MLIDADGAGLLFGRKSEMNGKEVVTKKLEGCKAECHSAGTSGLLDQDLRASRLLLLAKLLGINVLPKFFVVLCF